MTEPSSGPWGRRTPAQIETLTLGVVLVLAATGFRIWALHGTWWFYDDFYFIQRALSHDPTPSFLLTPYNGHLMPAGVLLTWVNTHLAPMGFGLAATEMVVLFTVAGLAMLRLLVRLFGARRAVLLPLLLFLFSPILLPATTWWAAGVNQLPMLIAEILALDSFVAYLRSPSRKTLAANLLWLVVGLLFVERTLLVFGALWLVALMYFAVGTLPDRCRDLWHRYRPALSAHALVVGVYVACYIVWVLDFDARSMIRRPFFEVVHDMVVIAFSSAFVGGPVNWDIDRVTQSEAHPSQAVLLLGWTVLVGLVVASARTRTRGLRAWLLPLYVLGANIALISVSRAIYFGPEIALDYRFQTEAAVMTALAVGLAFLPLVDARESSGPVAARPGQYEWRLDTPAWAVVGGLVFLALATVSTARFPLRNLTSTSPDAYMDNVVRSAHEQPGTQLLDLPTPEWMWAPLAYPTNTYSHMFEPLDVDLRITQAPTDDASIVDETGRFRTLSFVPARTIAPVPHGPGIRCQRRVTPGTHYWRLDGPVFGFGWYARLTYEATSGGTATLVTDGNARRITLREGSHTSLVPVSGAFTWVTVKIPTGSTPWCLEDLEIGQVTPGR